MNNRPPSTRGEITIGIFTALIFITYITSNYFLWKQSRTSQRSAEAAETAARATAQQLEGTMSAVVVFEEPRLTPDPITAETILLIQVVNQGHIIAPEAHVMLAIDTVSVPKETTTFESKADTIAFQQLVPGGGNSKAYNLRTFLQRDRDFLTQRKTITVQGMFGFDNGFGHKFEQPICYSYIGRFNFKNEGAGSTSGGDGFYPCDRFKELVPYIFKHPLN